MKILFAIGTLFCLTIPALGQNFTIDSNGIVKCPNAKVGEKGTINGVEYEAVDNDLLRSIVGEWKPKKFHTITNELMLLVFEESRSSEQINLSRLCTSLVTDMTGIFKKSEFNQPIGNWDVSRVTNMSQMFWGSKFNQAIDNWDVSNVSNMSAMFSFSAFNQPIGKWDTGNVKDMSWMFDRSNFNQPINRWCLINIKEEPKGFSTKSQLSQHNKPRFGECQSN
jgi:surface protein